jgi:hypothetical protein
MGGWRHAVVLAGLTALAAVACTPASGHPPAVRDPAAGRRFTHAHDFPYFGIRLAPPTGGRPRLSWQQAYRAVVLGPSPSMVGSRQLPQVKLADYRDTNRDLTRPVQAWVVVYVDAPVPRLSGFGGPDFGPIRPRPQPRPRPRDRCPLYVVVNATSGRSYNWFQSCRPPYRG